MFRLSIHIRTAKGLPLSSYVDFQEVVRLCGDNVRGESSDGHSSALLRCIAVRLPCEVLCIIVFEVRQDVGTSGRRQFRNVKQTKEKVFFFHISLFEIYVLNLSIHVSCWVLPRRVARAASRRSDVSLHTVNEFFSHFVFLYVSAFLNLFLCLRFFSPLFDASIRRMTFNRHSGWYEYEMHQISHHSLTFNSSSIVPKFGLRYFDAFCGLWPRIVRVSSESESNFAISVSESSFCVQNRRCVCTPYYSWWPQYSWNMSVSTGVRLARNNTSTNSPLQVYSNILSA